MSNTKELIKRSFSLGKLINAIEQVMEIEVTLISDQSCISDFVGNDDKSILELNQKLGIQVGRSDTLIEVVDRLMLMSNLKGSN